MKKFLPIVFATCIAICILIYGVCNKNPVYDVPALMTGNVLLAMLSLITYVNLNNGIKANNPNAFVRAKMTSTMIRIFAFVMLILAYIFIVGKVNVKPNVFFFMGIYVIYTIIESAILSNLAKDKK